MAIEQKSFNQIMSDLVKALAGPIDWYGVAAQTWTYPDGTQGTNEPSDGARFATQNGNIRTEWAWDGLQQQWHRLADYHMSPSYVDFIQVNITIPRDPECECGNPKNPVGQGHSHWCKLFKQEF